jgi:predicted outer membrane repeat protein
MLIVDSHVILESVQFTNNSAQNGGAVYVATLPSKFPFSLTLKSTLFQNNRATNNGGALHISRVSVDAMNTVLRCNRAGNLHQSYGSDLYCESSTSAFDFMSDVKSAGVACPSGSSNACAVTYQNLTSSGLQSQSLCGKVSVCDQFSDQSLGSPSKSRRGYQ